MPDKTRRTQNIWRTTTHICRNLLSDTRDKTDLRRTRYLVIAYSFKAIIIGRHGVSKFVHEMTDFDPEGSEKRTILEDRPSIDYLFLNADTDPDLWTVSLVFRLVEVVLVSVYVTLDSIVSNRS